MTREEARKAAEVMLAYAEGKEIECRDGHESQWREAKEPSFDWDFLDYRIKPEFKYRPFKDAEEYWKEMLKHKPFGWVIKHGEYKILVCEVLSYGVVLHKQEGSCYDFTEANRIFTFADGKPFGALEGHL